jgi:hypothetical protein
MRYIIAIFLMSLCAVFPASAQLLSAPGWNQTSSQNGTTKFTHEDGISTVSLTGVPSFDGKDLDYWIGELQKEFVGSKNCGQLASAKPVVLFSGEARKAATPLQGAGCHINLGRLSDGRGVIMIGLDGDSRDRKAEVFSDRMLAAFMGKPENTNSSSAVSNAATDASVSETRAKLQAALARVPAANRPVGFVTMQGWATAGMNQITVFRPWLIFNNGNATNCFGWDPITQAATAQSLVKNDNCEVKPWRKLAGQYQLSDGEGGWTDVADYLENSAFPKGQKVNYELENWDSSGGRIANAFVYSTVNARNLSLTPDERVRFGTFNHTYDRGGWADAEGVFSGQYYLDGNMMAVMQRDGTVRIHYVANYSDDMLILDGLIYSPDRTKRD